MRLSKEEKRETISILKKYPDWIVRIECKGLGGEPVGLGGYWEEDFSSKNKDWRHSVIEDYIEYEEDVVRKIFAIERVFERLSGDRKEIIRLRYLLPDNTPQDIMKKLNLSEGVYFRLQNSTLVNFARTLGIIE